MTSSLPASVEVLPGTDVDRLWDLFEIFEALHHSMTICNPMSESDMDAVVNALAPTGGDRVLDVACGFGELLMRLAGRAEIDGVGLDLSPWMIQGAHSRASRRMPNAQLRWVLGEGRNFGVTASDSPDWDVTCCLGASWIWQGMPGTIREVVRRTRPGGRIAVGDMRLRDGCDPDQVAKKYGRVFTADDAIEHLGAAGVELVARVDTDDDAWDAYLERTATAAHDWAGRNPGPVAMGYLDEQRSWVTDHERDRDILTWTVWVGRLAD